VWTINGFLYTAILAYARSSGFIERPAVTRRMVLLYVIGPLGYLAAIGISFLNIYAGIALYVALSPSTFRHRRSFPPMFA
jgi:hypothetical protein